MKKKKKIKDINDSYNFKYLKNINGEIKKVNIPTQNNKNLNNTNNNNRKTKAT